MRPASPILIGQNPVGHPVMPSVLLVLTGPAGPSVPQGPVAGKVSGAGWSDPGQDRSGLWLRNGYCSPPILLNDLTRTLLGSASSR